MAQPDRIIERRYARHLPTIFRDAEPDNLLLSPIVLSGADAYRISIASGNNELQKWVASGRGIGFARRILQSLEPTPQRLTHNGFGIALVHDAEISVSFGTAKQDPFNSLRVVKYSRNIYADYFGKDPVLLSFKEPVFVGKEYSKGKELQLRKNLNHIDTRYCSLSLVHVEDQLHPMVLVEDLSHTGTWMNVKSTRGEYIPNPYLEVWDTPADPRNGLENLGVLGTRKK